MREPTQRFVYLLAASGIPLGEIYAALQMSCEYGPSRIMEEIEMARSEIARGPARHGRADRYVEPRRKSSKTVVGEIDQLLRRQAGLNSMDAAHLLMDELRDGGFMGELPEINQKDGLIRWLQKIVRLVPGSLLLHSATRVQNRIRGRQGSDWPLGDH